jgi:tetratricopeptide (TPR) repeat protein
MFPMRAALFCLLAPLPALAQEPPPAVPPVEPPAEATPSTPRDRLETLFETLADENAADPRRTAHRIAEIWSQSGSDSMDLLLSRGREAMEDEAYEKAVDHFTALVELAPDFAEGWNGRATAHFLNDEYWLAVADIQRVLALEPRHFGALSGLAIIMERVGEDAKAMAAARAAIAVNPHMEEAQEAVKRLAPKVDGRDI